MINEKVFLKFPLNFKNKCKIYPPSINEVIKDERFSLYRKLLTISQEEIEDEFNEKELDMNDLLTPFEYLLNNVYNHKEIRAIACEAFKFFIHEDVTFLCEHKKIVIGKLEEVISNVSSIDDLIIIEEEEYFEFQNLLREALGEQKISPPDPNENPKIKKMKAKARYRDRIKAQSGVGLKLSSSLVSICCMNFGLNPLNIGELSYAAIHPLIRYYQEKEKYQLDIDSLLAGADSKKIKPKYWVRNIED
jgi:hypothetical protein